MALRASLITARRNVKKRIKRGQKGIYSQNYEIVHMIINQYVINGVVYKILPENFDGDNLVIQVNFICLEKKNCSKF